MRFELGGRNLGLASNPSLCEYFVFLVKSQDKLNRHVIDEAEGFWESLVIIYELENTLPEVEKSLERIIKESTSDLTFKHLGIIRNLDATVSAQQLVFNDVLIFIISQNSPENHETDTPESNWEEQLEIEVTSRDLKNILGEASIIHTKSEHYKDILMKVRINIPFAKDQTINYCTLDFGHLWRFGKNNKFLLVIDPEHANEEKVNRFFNNNIPYILPLYLIIKKDYQIFLNLHKRLEEIKIQIEQHNQELLKIKHETDSIMLAIRKDHIEELRNELNKIEVDIKKCAEEINLNLLKLKAAIKNLTIINDEIFIEDIKLFESYNNYIQNWLPTGNDTFKSLQLDITNYTAQINGLIKALGFGGTDIDSTLKPKTYTPSRTISDRIEFEESPYKQIKDEFASRAELESGLLDIIPLQWGSSYIILEPDPSKSLKIFSDLVTERFMGLGITQQDREKIISEFKLKHIEFFQINTESGDEFLPPVLSKISHLINEFLSENYHSIIYLDGLDFLIKYNDFPRVLKFWNNINESIVLNDAVFIMSVNTSVFDENQIELLLKGSINISKAEIGLEDLL